MTKVCRRERIGLPKGRIVMTCDKSTHTKDMSVNTGAELIGECHSFTYEILRDYPGPPSNAQESEV